ncbi:MAG: signal peptidase I [Puniceicoccaceae bacterium]
MRSPLPKKLRKGALELLSQAEKVQRYRSDLIPPDELKAIDLAVENLAAYLVDPEATENRLKALEAGLDEKLQRHGGTFHPKTSLADNIETIVVAAIVVIGIRTFFFQPFIIPTNSMYPSYSGMQVEVYAAPEEEGPGTVEQIFRTVTLGSSRLTYRAEQDGEVWLGVREERQQNRIRFSPVVDIGRGRKWLVVPAQKQIGLLRVGSQIIEVKVPLEFADLAEVYNRAFFPDRPGFSFGENIQQLALRQRPMVAGNGLYFFALGKQASAGETVLDFEILSGDALFVDRMTYHFRRPKPGDPVVFRTGKIPDLGDRYYIKRLVGTPGDVLELRDPKLFSNGELLEGADAFLNNYEQVEGYGGYTTLKERHLYLKEGRPMQVPPGVFFVLGDNSPNSADSRVFGFVPEKEVIGRAILIYYPFTKRWGISE